MRLLTAGIPAARLLAAFMLLGFLLVPVPSLLGALALLRRTGPTEAEQIAFDVTDRYLKWALRMADRLAGGNHVSAGGRHVV